MLQILPIFGNSIIHLIMFCISPIMLRLCSIYSTAQFHLFVLLHICLAAAWCRIYCNFVLYTKSDTLGALSLSRIVGAKKSASFLLHLRSNIGWIQLTHYLKMLHY